MMFIEMLKVLASPLGYLRIRHEAKRWVDWAIPSLFTLLSAWALLSFGRGDVIGGADGLTSKMLIVVSVLPGFYIAALAAIATFSNSAIDQQMAGNPPVLRENIGGIANDIPLTRRRFLSYLFAFLCFESLVAMVACVFGSLIGPGLAEAIPLQARFVTRVGSLLVLLMLFWQMLTVTCLGLYYLGERLHRPTR